MEPKEVIKHVLIGNIAYANETANDFFDPMLDSQNPQVTLVTCSDSRIRGRIFGMDTTNYIFHIRNIGNQIYSNEGSVDYGIVHLKTPLLLVLGHTDCGAVKATIGGYGNETDGIKKELGTLERSLSESFEDEDKLVKHVRYAQTNVDSQVRFAMDKYSDRVKSGNLAVVGAILDIHGVYSSNRGELYIINVNGINDPSSIQSMEVLSSLDQGLRDAKVKRI